MCDLDLLFLRRGGERGRCAEIGDQRLAMDRRRHADRRQRVGRPRGKHLQPHRRNASPRRAREDGVPLSAMEAQDEDESEGMHGREVAAVVVEECLSPDPAILKSSPPTFRRKSPVEPSKGTLV